MAGEQKVVEAWKKLADEAERLRGRGGAPVEWGGLSAENLARWGRMFAEWEASKVAAQAGRLEEAIRRMEPVLAALREEEQAVGSMNRAAMRMREQRIPSALPSDEPVKRLTPEEIAQGNTIGKLVSQALPKASGPQRRNVTRLVKSSEDLARATATGAKEAADRAAGQVVKSASDLVLDPATGLEIVPVTFRMRANGIEDVLIDVGMAPRTLAEQAAGSTRGKAETIEQATARIRLMWTKVLTHLGRHWGKYTMAQLGSIGLILWMIHEDAQGAEMYSREAITRYKDPEGHERFVEMAEESYRWLKFSPGAPWLMFLPAPLNFIAAAILVKIPHELARMKYVGDHAGDFLETERRKEEMYRQREEEAARPAVPPVSLGGPKPAPGPTPEPFVSRERASAAYGGEWAAIKLPFNDAAKAALKEAAQRKAKFNDEHKQWEVPLSVLGDVADALEPYYPDLAKDLRAHAKAPEAAVAPAPKPVEGETPPGVEERVVIVGETAHISFPYDEKVKAALKRARVGARWDPKQFVWIVDAKKLIRVADKVGEASPTLAAKLYDAARQVETRK